MRAGTRRWRADDPTLADLPGRAFDARLEPPTLIVVGDVVKLQSKFAWFDPAAGTPATEVAVQTAGAAD